MIELKARVVQKTTLTTDIPNEWDIDLKLKLRKIGKNLPEYHEEITTTPLVNGRDDSGKEIPINTLGRWVFGTPGFKGHIIAPAGTGDNVTVQVADVPEAVQLMNKILEELK